LNTFDQQLIQVIWTLWSVFGVLEMFWHLCFFSCL